MPSGDISVIPQACTTRMPKESKERRSDSGAALPPMIMRSRGKSFPSHLAVFFSSSAMMANPTVGTPPLSVTCSPAHSSRSDGASRYGPGKTCLAPTMVAAMGIPQALAWNIGTIGRTVSA